MFMVSKVGYLGPEGSYTHITTNKLFGNPSQYELVAIKTISALIDALQESKVDQIVVPVENSIAGNVNETLDALAKSENLYINQEYTLDINHCLLALKDLELEHIHNIYSHTMSFAQCRDFIKMNIPAAELQICSSNSAAADKVLRKGLETDAVIGPKLCAEIYKLKVLVEGINDEPNNKTRFWIINRELARPSAADKTTIIFRTKDEAGSLVRILKIFSDAGINLSRIESRPARNNLGEYLFCIDLNIHQEEDAFIAAIKEAQRYFSFYKCLGSYNLL